MQICNSWQQSVVKYRLTPYYCPCQCKKYLFFICIWNTKDVECCCSSNSHNYLISITFMLSLCLHNFHVCLDPNIVLGSIIICTFSAGFNNGTSTLHAIIGTLKARVWGLYLSCKPKLWWLYCRANPFCCFWYYDPSCRWCQGTNKGLSIITIIYLTEISYQISKKASWKCR